MQTLAAISCDPFVSNTFSLQPATAQNLSACTFLLPLPCNGLVRHALFQSWPQSWLPQATSAHRVALAFDLNSVLVNHLAKPLNEVHIGRLQVLLVHIGQALQLLVFGLPQGLPVVSGLTM